MSSHAAYQLPAPAAFAHSLAQALPAFVAHEWFEHIDSTNAHLLKMARAQGAAAGWPRLCGAHHQTQGKGRLGRRWHDLPGQTLMFSVGFALPAALGPGALQGLGPALGWASTAALRPLLSTPEALLVKWPNDLMFGHGKCAGILIELTNKAEATFVVIGMGLNLSGHASLQTDLGREVADIGTHLLPDITAEQLVTVLAATWQQTLQTLLDEGFEPCRKRYADLDYLACREVTVIDRGHTIANGVVHGLAADGSLQIRTASGVESFHAGDVSVRLNTKAGQT